MKWTLEELGEYADEHWDGEFRLLRISKPARPNNIDLRNDKSFRQPDEFWSAGFGEGREGAFGSTAEEAIERALTKAEQTHSR